MSKVRIVAHSGTFHTDDIFAVASLQLLLGEENTEVIRTRDEEIINSAEYVVDVGGVYDFSKNRFDHHQEGGAGSRDNGIPYASFGLVWKHFGEKICNNKEIADKVEELLVEWIDATDNGVQIIDARVPGVYPYDIGLYLNTFTPSWNSKNENFDDNFKKALIVAKQLLEREIDKRKNLIEARELVKKVYYATEDKRIIILDLHCPFNETLSKFQEPLFVVSPREDGYWNIKSIIDNPTTFIYRKYFPKNWGAKRGLDLERESGVSGAVFCHKDCFIAANKTKEGALEMAKKALDD